MIDVTKYNSLGYLTGVQNYTYPKFHTFVVNERDYQLGYAYRYFVHKINDTSVIEVSGKNYNTIPLNLFNKIVLTWYLTGPARNVYVDGSLYEYGLYEKNLREINAAATIMPSLKNLITDCTLYGKSRKS